MQFKSMAINNLEDFWLNETEKSLAYFSKKKFTKVDKGLLAELKRISDMFNGKNVRLCLHSSPESTFHNMIILEHKGKYYRPHKHQTKGELFHLIEGSMAVFIFQEDGSPIDICILEKNTNLIFKIDMGIYHCIMPLSDLVVYHESNPGPFLAKNNSIFPDWAPDGSDESEIIKFNNKLLEILESTIKKVDNKVI